MKKLKQICAIKGIILLVALYVSTLVFAIIDDPATMNMLKASIMATVIIPVFIWILGRIADKLKKDSDQSKNTKIK